MSWKEVGNWLKGNAGNGAALVGSLLSGNVLGAVSAGAAMVSGVTGTTDPAESLRRMQADPSLIIELEKVKNEREEEVNRHLETVMLAELEDAQKEHEQTQLTVRNGDNAEGNIKWVRPLQSTASLVSAIVYVFMAETVSFEILGLLLALPWGYAGLRQIGKWKEAPSLDKLSK